MRRAALIAGLVVALAACRAKGERCARCGMVIAPKSAWEAELTSDKGDVTRFDTPRCAIRAFRAAAPSPRVELRVHEFYTGEMRSAKDVVFVVGSDLVGPMGPELVPVDPARAQKLTADHAGKRTLTLDAVDERVLGSGDTP